MVVVWGLRSGARVYFLLRVFNKIITRTAAYISTLFPVYIYAVIYMKEEVTRSEESLRRRDVYDMTNNKFTECSCHCTHTHPPTQN